MKIICFIEETKNEAFYRQVIKEGCPEAEVLLFRKGKDALASSLLQPADLLLADLCIRRRTGSQDAGFLFLETFRRNPLQKYTPLIIVSDVDDEELYSYSQLHSYACFTKPLNRGIFRTEVGGLIRYHAAERERVLRNLLNPTCSFLTKEGVLMAREEEIVRFELHSKYGLVVLEGKAYSVNAGHLRTERKLLESRWFLQCNRSDFVNIRYVRRVDREKVILEPCGEAVYLSEQGRKNFRQWFKR